MKAQAFSRRLTAPKYTGDAALLYIFPSNMVSITTEKVVGLFQGVSLEDNPGAVTIDFYLNDPSQLLPTADAVWDGAGWSTQASLDVVPEKWFRYDTSSKASLVKERLEALHQFTIPTGVNLIGLSDDWVRIEDYKWVAIRVAFATDPAADVYVQITPQTQPEGI